MSFQNKSNFLEVGKLYRYRDPKHEVPLGGYGWPSVFYAMRTGLIGLLVSIDHTTYAEFVAQYDKKTHKAMKSGIPDGYIYGLGYDHGTIIEMLVDGKLHYQFERFESNYENYLKKVEAE